MARLLRGTGEHFLRPPTVLGPSIQFWPVRVYTAVAVHRTEGTGRKRRDSRYRLGPPVAVGPSLQFRKLQVGLAVRSSRADLHRYRTVYWVQPPTVVVASLARPLRIALAPSPARSRRLQYKVQYDLRAPVVTAASIVFAPLSVYTKTATRRAGERHPAKSRLGTPPAGITLLTAPVRVLLARVRRVPTARSRLSRPSISGPSIVFRPLRTTLARGPSAQRYPKGQSRLLRVSLPAVVAAVAARLRTLLGMGT